MQITFMFVPGKAVMDDSVSKDASSDQHFCDVCNLEYLTKNASTIWSLYHFVGMFCFMTFIWCISATQSEFDASNDSIH